jgi:predicted hydrocarbon binding protein
MGETAKGELCEITQEVVDTLIHLMENVIGKPAVRIVLNQFPENENPLGRDLVFRFAEETQNLFGAQGAYAVLRQVGRDLAKSVASSTPEDQWLQALEQSLNQFGFAECITKGKEDASINACVFYPILEDRGLQPTDHAVCWAGWGFIEGFMKLIEGVKGIKWVSRDIERKSCKFVYLR